MFFDDNIGFISLTLDNQQENNLLNSETGFLKGNMFKNEYKGYKNYQVKCPKASSEKEGYLYKIMELDFAINDLNLYLDLNPTDKIVFEKFKTYIEQLKNVEMEYEKKYGPLKLIETLGHNYNWYLDLPWQKEDSAYV